jgi:2-(3-amino-3-carboxypropyl)histidine synthase
METLFIEARSDLDIMPPKKSITLLPQAIGLVTTIQHVHKIGQVKQLLEQAGKKVFLLTGNRSAYEGQALGCDLFTLKPAKEIEAFLFIGTGEFHPQQLMLMQKKPVYTYNPESKIFSQLDKKEIEPIEKRAKGAYLKFLSSGKIGVLVTTKPGQQNLTLALTLKAKYPDKEFFYLIADTFDFGSLMDFPFIECFVNTACPRIGYDDSAAAEKPIVNIDAII